MIKDVIKVKSDGLFLNKSLNLSLQISRQDSHEGLGGKPVLGSLLVVSLGHVTEHGVGGLVDVVDDLSKVGLEVSLGEVLKVGQGGSGDVSLPLQSALAFLHHVSEVVLLLHVLDKGLGDLQLVSGEGVLVLLLIGESILGHLSSLTHVGGEDNQIEILVDIVHDLGLEEDLGGIVQDLVAQLGLGNVLSQLLDASTPSLGRTILVNDLVTLPLASLTICPQLSDQLFDDLKLSPEQCVLVGVHLVPVHLEQGEVHARHGLHQPLIRGRQLELFEHTSCHTGSGGSGQSHLIIENDGGVDGCSHKCVAQSVKILLQGRCRVANRDPHVNQTRKLLLESLNDIMEGDNGLDLNLILLLVNINKLELAIIVLHLSFAYTNKLSFILLQLLPLNIAKLGVLSDLVGRPGAERLPIDIDRRLLPQVEPDDLAILGVDGAAHLLKSLLETISSGLATQVNLVPGDPSEVGASRDGVGQLLDLLEVVGHGHSLPYLRIVRHPQAEMEGV